MSQTMNLELFLSVEDKMIYESLMQILSNDDPFFQATESEVANVNKLLPAIAVEQHNRLLESLIYTFVSKKFPDCTETIMRICFDCESSNIDIIDYEIKDIPVLCELLHIAFLNSKFSLNLKSRKIRSKSKEQLIELGAVYTQSSIANSIVEETIDSMCIPLEQAKILDFACGTGRFYECIISHFKNPAKAILKNVYAIDIDNCALHITRLKALSILKSVTNEDCITLCKHVALKDGLRTNNSLFSESNSILKNDLDGLANGGFDAIVSNPPYLVLKPNKSKAGVSGVDRIQEQVNYYRSSGIYYYSIEGMLNLYQLSIERMLQMLKQNGSLGVICPSTLFGDISASKLRKHLLSQNNILSIKFFAERVPLFENVNQATNIFVLTKGGSSTSIAISEGSETFVVDVDLVKELFPKNLEIPIIKHNEWEILRKLTKFKKLKEISNIRNRRGELDLSLCRKYITKEVTNYRLVRGNMIGETDIKDINGEFVLEDFVSTRSNEYRTFDFKKKRLVCQQISNGGQKKRIRFVFCKEDDILGNSCNYISSDEETLAKMFLLLNSSLLNWRFKITSSNNHINNYELDELPIIDLNSVDATFKYSTQEELDEYISALYGLNLIEKEIIKA